MSVDRSAGPVRWVRVDEVLWRRALDAVVALPASAAEPITLAGTGARLWDALASPRTVDDIAAQLAAEFNVDASTIVSDIEPAIRLLAGLGALRLVP